MRTEEPFQVLKEEIEHRRRLGEARTLSLNRERREAEHTRLEARRLRVLRSLGRAAAEEEGGGEAPAGGERIPELRDAFFLAEAARVVADYLSYRPGSPAASAAN